MALRSWRLWRAIRSAGSPRARPPAAASRGNASGQEAAEAHVQRISPQTAAVMRDLESRDATDRMDGTPQAGRIRAIGPHTGELLRTLVIAISARVIVEVGTGSGYSALWLAQGALITAGRITTFETDAAKAALARRTFKATGIEDYVDLRESDGGTGLESFAGRADLVFLDAEKTDYMRFLEPAILALRPGGLLLADNLTSHAADLAEFRAAALADTRLNGLVVPVGQGELLAVRL